MKRELDPVKLDWPSEEEAASDSLEANHDYVDLRGIDWPEVERILALERRVAERLAISPDAPAEWDAIARELRDAAVHVADIIDGPLYGLEPGTASAVLALSALGAVPFWSDGGGLQSGAGIIACPSVRFFALPSHVDALLAAAKAADVALQPDDGRCVVRTERSDGLLAFAEALLNLQRA